MWLFATLVAVSCFGMAVCFPQAHSTDGPFLRSTWPNSSIEGGDCLPYDGSKVPDCSKFVNEENRQPYYHEHSSNCSRFWECGPDHETCLFECAPCPCLHPDDQGCNQQCKSQDGGDDGFGYQYALTFDDRFHSFPYGPTCIWPSDYDGNCTNTAFGCHSSDSNCAGFDAVCQIPSHENCFWCSGEKCEIGCASDTNCPDTHPICGNGGADHRCGCNTDADCKSGLVCDTGDVDGNGDSHECLPTGCYGDNTQCPGWDAVCNVPAHDNCFYCDSSSLGECSPGCGGAANPNENCPANAPICGSDHHCSCTANTDCPTDLPICGTDGICKDGCLDNAGCDCGAICDITDYNNCRFCDGNALQCANGCCDNTHCPANAPICGPDNSCSCTANTDCPSDLPICGADGICKDGCLDNAGCDCGAICDITDYNNCHFCDGNALQCANGCCDNTHCPANAPICGADNSCSCTANTDCPTDLPICGTEGICKDGCLDNSNCGCEGICDITDYSNCNYCNVDAEKCADGCCSDSNCPTDHPKCSSAHTCGCKQDSDCETGFICDTDDSNGNGDNEECIPGCGNDDTNCTGFDESCDNPWPYENTCVWCNGDYCEPGCASDAVCDYPWPICGITGDKHKCGCNEDNDCDSSDVCNLDDHKCHGKPGSVLIKSVKITTDSCTGCSSEDEGVSLHLLGQPNLDGPYPCSTNTLDHVGSQDFASGSTVFDGSKNGATDSGEEAMMGGCFEAPLNGELQDGGTITWNGVGTWTGKTVCVEWSDVSKPASTCNVVNSGLTGCALVAASQLCP